METLQRRICEVMQAKGLQQSDLYDDVKDSAKISLIVNGKVKDPRISTLCTIAEKLDVSLDYLAGRTDNPSGMTDEELAQLKIDAEARALLRGFELLPPEGKETVQEMVDFQLSKSRNPTPPQRLLATADEVA